MNKKNKKKLIIALSSGSIILGSLAYNTKVGYGYSINNKKLRNINLYNNTTDKFNYAEAEENNKYLGEEQRKIAYITIDDGPSKYTKSIINILNKYNAKATFFMIDNNMKNYPDQVKNIIDSGHSAGFHTVSHDIYKLYKDNDSAKEEFNKNKETFYEITGMESKIVRLPYGSKPYTPSESYENLVEAGYKLWDWNIDTQDWKSDSTQIIENVKAYSKNKNDVVILIHEKRQTVEALEEILIYLISEGYEILAIDENQQPQNFWSNNLYK